MAIKTMKNYFHTHSQVIYLYLFICSFSILTQIQKKIRFVLYTKCIYKYKFLEKNPEDMNLKTWTIMFQCFILFCVKKLYNAFHVSVVYTKAKYNRAEYINFIPNLIIKKISLVRKWKRDMHASNNFCAIIIITMNK